ncbi:MAG: hypothetical protein HXS46_04380 [Theionarchaea archaeon]|nr:MAG: hypothetical protein AYK18_11210 [Theionarchaea archaeon DG-70]MBU7009901.1 hypothetical protein [Theionarchaea archaeon]
MHYELIAQCDPTERQHVIQEIEMSGGIIRDILEDQDKLLLFIEYNEYTQKKVHLLETLNNLVAQLGDAFTFPVPTA